MRRARSRVDGWQTGNYFRQLSIVVLGVLVTFVGSDIISGYYKQKEVTAVMNLVRAELQYNEEQLAGIQKVAMAEMRLFRILKEHDYRCDDIPQDTLGYYLGAFNSMNVLNYSDQALQVLKGSSLMQHVGDKEFLVSLLNTYQAGELFEERMRYYFNRKSAVWAEFLKAQSLEDINLFYDNNVRELYRVILSSRDIKNHIASSVDFFWEEPFLNDRRKWQEAIHAIDKNYN